MGREIQFWRHASCPCGDGSIEKHVESADNGWSRADVTFKLACPKCAKIFAEERGLLYHRDGRDIVRAAHAKYQAAEKELGELARLAIDEIVASKCFGKIKEEHEMLTQAGLCRDGPRIYKTARAEGQMPSERCLPWPDLGWILANLENSALRQRLIENKGVTERAEQKWRKLDKRHAPLSMQAMEHQRRRVFLGFSP